MIILGTFAKSASNLKDETFNLRTNILLFLAICYDKLFCVLVFSEPKTESVFFVIKVLKSTGYKLTDDEISNLPKIFVLIQTLQFSVENTDFLFKAYWIKIFIDNNEIRLDGYLNPQFRTFGH